MNFRFVLQTQKTYTFHSDSRILGDHQNTRNIFHCSSACVIFRVSDPICATTQTWPRWPLQPQCQGCITMEMTRGTIATFILDILRSTDTQKNRKFFFRRHKIYIKKEKKLSSFKSSFRLASLVTILNLAPLSLFVRVFIVRGMRQHRYLSAITVLSIMNHQRCGRNEMCPYGKWKMIVDGQLSLITA